MNTNLKLAAFAVSLALIGAGCAPENTKEAGVTATPETKTAATVEITASGYSPKEVTIKAGETVRFMNRDTAKHWPASGPHPTHTNLPGFDALHALAQNESYSFTFMKAGTFGYHDHMNPSLTGKVIVE